MFFFFFNRMKLYVWYVLGMQKTSMLLVKPNKFNKRKLLNDIYYSIYRVSEKVMFEKNAVWMMLGMILQVIIEICVMQPRNDITVWIFFATGQIPTKLKVLMNWVDNFSLGHFFEYLKMHLMDSSRNLRL